MARRICGFFIIANKCAIVKPFLSLFPKGRKKREGNPWISPRAFLGKLVSQNRNSVAGDLGDEIENPEDKADGRNDGQNADDQGSGVIGLGVADDSVNAANDCAQDELQKDLYDLGQILIGLGKAIVCHGTVLQSDVFPRKFLIYSIAYCLSKIKASSEKSKKIFTACTE
jgi:hypothetical protein